MSTTYTQPDYCPVCHNGEWADRDNCDYCDGAGYVCPIDRGILALYDYGAVEDFGYVEVWECLACDWVSESL